MRVKAANDQPKTLQGLAEVAGMYDGFILDLWGVVHDGVKPFPRTVETLTKLKQANRIIWMLSNAPRRAHFVVSRLTAMGIGPHLYDGIMTSGEATWLALQSRYLEQWGRKCYHLGPKAKDDSLYEGLDIALVDDPAQADFLLASGVYDFDDPAEKYLPVLEACIKARLPMLCANPDRIVHVEDKLVVCAGTFADMYIALGGEVVYLGKPHSTVYRLCLEGMGVKRVLAVGDGMQTDIEGASGAGLDSVLITSGIHRDAVKDTSFLQSYPARPTYLMSALLWEEF